MLIDGCATSKMYRYVQPSPKSVNVDPNKVSKVVPKAIKYLSERILENTTKTLKINQDTSRNRGPQGARKRSQHLKKSSEIELDKQSHRHWRPWGARKPRTHILVDAVEMSNGFSAESPTRLSVLGTSGDHLGPLGTK